MAHFAKLDENNHVLEIFKVANEALDPAHEEESGIEFLTTWSGGYTKWKQCSYNASFRKCYPGLGYRYDEEIDAFIAPQPFQSWSLNRQGDWVAPKNKPEEGSWLWDESKGDWVDASQS